MERMHVKTRELDHLKMTDQIVTATRGDDPATTTTTTLREVAASYKDTIIKAMIAEIVGITMTAEMT
jgi:hypothetical protein